MQTGASFRVVKACNNFPYSPLHAAFHDYKNSLYYLIWWQALLVLEPRCGLVFPTV